MTDGPSLDQAGFESLYARTARPLWTYLRRVLGSPADADDLLQETFLRYLAGAPAGLDDGASRAYLFTIASRLVVDHWRRGRRRPAVVDADVSGIAAPPPDVATTIEVARALDALKPQERAMLWLAYVEGSPHRQIAEAFGVKEHSVKVLLYRARQRLMRLLNQ